MLIAGGFTGQEDTLAMTELYDASSRRLTSAARMVTPRRIVRPLSGHVHGDRLDERAAGEPRRRGSPTAASSSLAGGADRAEIFDPGTVSFQLVEGEARMAGQFSATAPMANGGVLITGGYGEHLGPQAAAWLYVP